MSNASNLSPTAKIILGFLRFRPRSGYDIKQAVEISTRFFWGASYGQIYPELRRLERLGLVEAAASSRSGRRRTEYRLTRRGEQALGAWLESDTQLFQYRDEGLLRLFFADLGDPEAALRNVRRMREWRDEAAAFFRSQIEPHAREDADQGYRFPLRALAFGTAWLAAQAEWLSTLERELESELKGR